MSSIRGFGNLEVLNCERYMGLGLFTIWIAVSQLTLRSCKFALLAGEDRWDDSDTTSQLQMSGDGTTGGFMCWNSWERSFWWNPLQLVFLGGGNSNIFYFHPHLGKIPHLTHIFQMGWNHQRVFHDVHTQTLKNREMKLTSIFESQFFKRRYRSFALSHFHQNTKNKLHNAFLLMKFFFF